MVSERARRLPRSPIRALSPFAEQAKARGTTVYHLNIGQPDIESPREYLQALQEFQGRILAYEPARGSPELCEAWANYMNGTLGTKLAPESFLITHGASEALLFAMVSAADAGDEILVFEPTYANYIGFAELAGVRLVPVETRIADNFALPTDEQIERVMNQRTRAILLCNPNNPTGTVYSRADLERLLALCERQNLLLIVDETYREFIYDGSTPLSIYHLGEGTERAIVVDSLSKRFSLCGARIGCLIATSPEVWDAAHRMAQSRLAAPSLEQFAATKLLRTISPQFVAQVVTEYRNRRDVLFSELKQIAGLQAHLPQGAFYTMVKLPVADAEVFGTFLLREFAHQGATTFITPAHGFYLSEGKGQSEARIAYVLTADAIRSAVGCLGRGLEEFCKRGAS